MKDDTKDRVETEAQGHEQPELVEFGDALDLTNGADPVGVPEPLEGVVTWGMD